jgi:hypothetical protein
METTDRAEHKGESEQPTKPPQAQPGLRQHATRRGGVRLAAAGTAALAALPLGVAAASNDDDDDRGRDRDDRLRGLERALEAREEALRRYRERLEDRLDRLDDLDVAFRLDDFGTGPAQRLFRVVDVNGDDFDRGSDPQNRDGLTWGAVRLDRENNNDARIQVVLDGAAPNATYEVVFVGIRDNRIGLGWVRTNGSGDFDGYSRSNQDNTGDPRRLGGGNRVGVFVLTRDRGDGAGVRDQFVTALGTRPA